MICTAGLNAPVFQRCQQAVMRGGDKRHRDAFADQIFGFRDAFLYHQRFGISELRRQQENFNRHLLAGGHRQRAGAQLPICTSPEANARTIAAPLSNLRQSTFAPLALAKVLSACATFAGSAEV